MNGLFESSTLTPLLTIRRKMFIKTYLCADSRKDRKKILINELRFYTLTIFLNWKNVYNYLQIIVTAGSAVRGDRRFELHLIDLK